MAQTLGCLVASMTVGALLLHLVQPKPEQPAPAPAIELIAHSITQPWQQIRVEPGHVDGRIDPRHTHFFVDREGRWSYTETWQTQSHLGRKGVVQIALQPSANTNKVTAPQWETTRRLMAVLLKECSIPNDTSHVVFNESLAVPPAPARKTVNPGGRTSVGQVNFNGSR